MVITITSTDQIVEIDGVACRHWKGLTDKGVPCHVFVHRVAVPDDEDSAQFEAELLRQPGSDGSYVFPLGLIL